MGSVLGYHLSADDCFVLFFLESIDLRAIKINEIDDWFPKSRQCPCVAYLQTQQTPLGRPQKEASLAELLIGALDVTNGN
jgi:hypothetical protein